MSRETQPLPADCPVAVTAFVFQVRNIPAALYKVMGGFATNGVNMTKLESYMVGGSFTATQFYAEVEGAQDDPAMVTPSKRWASSPIGHSAGNIPGRSGAAGLRASH